MKKAIFVLCVTAFLATVGAGTTYGPQRIGTYISEMSKSVYRMVTGGTMPTSLIVRVNVRGN